MYDTVYTCQWTVSLNKVPEKKTLLCLTGDLVDPRCPGPDGGPGRGGGEQLAPRRGPGPGSGNKLQEKNFCFCSYFDFLGHLNDQ